MGCSQGLAGHTYSCRLINQQTLSEHPFSAKQKHCAQHCGKLEKVKGPRLSDAGFCWGEKTKQARSDPWGTVWTEMQVHKGPAAAWKKMS